VLCRFVARIFGAAEQVELDQLRLQLDAIQAGAMQAPTMGAFLAGNSLAKFMAAEERKISVSDRTLKLRRAPKAQETG
jgi:hypothetical protein